MFSDRTSAKLSKDLNSDSRPARRNVARVDEVEEGGHSGTPITLPTPLTFYGFCPPF
jgi:hypothetical protein